MVYALYALEQELESMSEEDRQNEQLRNHFVMLDPYKEIWEYVVFKIHLTCFLLLLKY